MQPSGNKKNEIKKVIVRTIAFFDMFAFPLNCWEIWKYGIWGEAVPTISDVMEAVDELLVENALEQSEGYHYLPNRRVTVLERKKRYNYFRRKLKRLKLVARLFSLLPWIRLVAIANVIGNGNLKDESDIDVFIISGPRRVWLSRFFCAGLMKILGLRPEQGNEKDKICLNFYLESGKENLRTFMLDGADLDVYFLYWTAFIKPVYCRGNSYDEFMDKNSWVNTYLPNWRRSSSSTSSASLTVSASAISGLLDLLNEKARNWQEKIFPSDIKCIKNKDKRVVVSGSVIKLHTKDRRQHYLDEWKNKIKQINAE